jgi:hypothetical protein
VPAPVEQPSRAALLTVAASDDARLAELVADGFDTVVLVLERGDAAAAAARVRARGLRLAGWIEVGRCPELADAQPQ